MYLHLLICFVICVAANYEELTDELVRERVRSCIGDLNRKYGLSQHISIEQFDEMVDRRCCPLNQYPCPYDLWGIRFGNNPIKDYLKKEL